MNKNNSELPDFRIPLHLKVKDFSLYQLIKNNLAIFLLAPTMIGGIYQIWQLTNIELSFIRFFSVSQVVSDGLMILIGMLFLIFSVFYVGLIIYILPEIKENDSKRKKAFKIITTLSCCYFLFELSTINKKAVLANEIIILLIIKLSLISSFLYLIYEVGKISYFYLLKKKYTISYDDFLELLVKKHQKVVEKIAFFILAIIIVILSFSMHDLLLSFNDYNRIENFKVIEQKIKDSNLVQVNPDIVFYNKDYLFINLNLVKSCRCDIDKICTKKNILENYQWIEKKYRVIDGKELMEIYK